MDSPCYGFILYNPFSMRHLILLFAFTFSFCGSLSLQASQAPAPLPVQAQLSPEAFKANLKNARKAWKAERKQMTREEKRAYRAKAKQFRRQLREARRQNADEEFLLIVIVTILLPPLGVFLYEGDITSNFWISLLLTLLFFVPGLVFSLLVVFDAI